MPHPSERYRDPVLVRELAERIHATASARPLRFMHVCGTHENAIARHGLRTLLPDGLEVIAGPGCPVCVCPPADIDLAVRLALDHGAGVATVGDMMRVPGRLSLTEARARGGDVRVVDGAAGAARWARAEPDRQVVLFAVGFETTACTTAAAVLADPPPNLSFLLSHRLIPPALDALLTMDDLRIDGFLMPGHVMTVTGIRDYEPLAASSGRPMVVAGFEPVDVMLGLAELARLARDGRGEVLNAYPRAVRTDGNPRALEMMDRVFVPVDARWRGLGEIPGSGLALRPDPAHRDACERFGVRPDPELPDSLPGCACGDVMAGRIDPLECVLFGEACTPERPRGPCMVSFEGTCRNRYQYREE